VRTVHRQERLFACAQPGCHLRFGQEVHRRAHHSQVHGGERPFRCRLPGCSQSFGRREHLVQHKRAVHDGKKHVCQDCNKTYSQPSDLVAHVATKHGAGRPYLCPEPGCGERFGWRGDRRDHVQSIHAGLRHACTCGASYAWRAGLNRHKRARHGASAGQ
jgi:uncharacterized Zn-finger protein